MIQHKGDVSMNEVRLSDGHAYLKGTLDVDLLYVEEDGGRVCSLSAKLPMEETLNLNGIVSGDKMCLKWEIEDLSLHVIHSRKLNIKAIVTFYAVVDELTGIRLPVGISGEEVSLRKKPIRTLNLAVHKKDTLRIRQEITLVSNKPNIEELIWYTASLRGLDLRPEENQIRAKGEVFVFAMYAGAGDDSPIQWLENSLPFNSEVECSGSKEELIPNIDVSVLSQTIEVKPDSDGEERILAVDVVVELDMKLYREETYDLLLDVYTPKKECILKSRPETLESLLVRNFSRCRISDHIDVKETQGKVLQVCHTQGKVKIDKTSIVENGIAVDGIVHMKILYITGNDEMPFSSMEAMLPFSHVIEARGITEECSYHLQTELEMLSTTMSESSRLEIKAVVGLNVLVLSPWQEQIIERVEEQPLDMEKIRSMPGITVYYVRDGDTLWDIARRFYTTVDAIRQQNELGQEEPAPGSPLLLVKTLD
jgi:hypothetical protein